MGTYKLFAFDIDGTLSVSGQKIPTEVIESLKRCVKSDIVVVPSTGKKFTSIQALCQIIAIEGPVITCNGAIIIEAGTQKILFSRFLAEDLFRNIVSKLKKDGINDIAVFTDRDIVCTDTNLASKLLSCINEPTTRFVDCLLDLSSENVAKILIAFENTERLRYVYDSYFQRYSQKCSIVITSEKFLEFMSLNVSKGKALLELAESFGIAKDNIVCIGDSDNDLSMFRIAGLSIAVSNATPSLLQAADVVVPPASEGGVVEAINNYVFGEKGGGKQ